MHRLYRIKTFIRRLLRKKPECFGKMDLVPKVGCIHCKWQEDCLYQTDDKLHKNWEVE